MWNDALWTFFRKLVWFIQLLILNTITKLYPSGGITTFCTEKPLYLYNVTRTRKIQFNSTCSDGKGKLTSEVCCCHWHYRWKYKRNLNQKNNWHKNLKQELKLGLPGKEKNQPVLKEKHSTSLHFRTTCNSLSLPSSKIKLIVWQFYSSTTNSFSLVSPNSHRKQGTPRGSCCTTNPWTWRASQSESICPFVNKGWWHCYPGLKSRKSATNS